MKEKLTPATCRHCGRFQRMTRRRLCWTCRTTPGIRALYPSTSKFVRAGAGSANGTYPLPALPTAYPPGSPEKVQVMANRVARGVQPHHPADS